MTAGKWMASMVSDLPHASLKQEERKQENRHYKGTQKL